MMNCSQGINQKRKERILFFWESSTDRLHKTLLSAGEGARSRLCTDVSNYLLSYTFAFLYIFAVFCYELL